MRNLFIGLDVGSTTVKAVVVDATDDDGAIVWQDYQRHDTRQAETVHAFLERIERDVGARHDDLRIFVTGSGGGSLAPHLGAKFVQEVNAVSLAVEARYPECGSVIELGGQDAKIIVFRDDHKSGRKRKIPSMNDKCAGGTGAVIDKIAAKLGIAASELGDMGYRGLKLHSVAGKCGVFAETDINGLQKLGVPPDELMASLFGAIVDQNLTVLTRGNTLLPHVLLLGGPNTFIRGMVEAWKAQIPSIWAERNTPLPHCAEPAELIRVPGHGQYFAALGAVEFGRREAEVEAGAYRGRDHLREHIATGRSAQRKGGAAGLSANEAELDQFLDDYRPLAFEPARLESGTTLRAFVGLDGGSTSTKAVLLDEAGDVAFKAYELSKGNPIEDTKDMFRRLRRQVEDQGARLEVLGVGTTGYAKDILKDVLGADVALVETVAHTESALHFYDEVDVICDVGGQDIKLMILANGHVKDFKLNTQCSAGNGYFLQSTAQSFGVPIEEFAERAFSAAEMPVFGYGCAVFMQSDIVNFQRQGWSANEIMAGLAGVLPKNIWLYVSQIPNLSALGTHFVLQGGTQRNLAAVKAQVDFIRSRFKGKDVEPRIVVHRHCGESGAIGAAIEARRLHHNGRVTEFIGLDAVDAITYQTHRSEDTRCHFCPNTCLRTFIDVHATRAGLAEQESKKLSKVALPPGARRLIVGNDCEKGLVEDVEEMKVIKRGVDAVKRDNPNFVEIAAKAAWRSYAPPSVAEPEPSADRELARVLPLALLRRRLRGGRDGERARRRAELRAKRSTVRIGVPRIHNMYSLNPLFSGYFESLGVLPKNLVYSDFTSEEMYKEGARRGAIDPCFPAKVALSHVHNLLYVKHKRRPLDYIFFPMVNCLPSPLVATQGSKACPTVTVTPETVKAAFTKEKDVFAELGVTFINTFVHISERALFEREMFRQFEDLLGLSEDENRRAVAAGFAALDSFQTDVMRGGARKVLDQLEAEGRLGVVLLGRPYHNDPGINHGILDELQKLGYPIFTQDALPLDGDILERLFGDEVRAGAIRHPLDIGDVWKHNYSENTNRKLFAAKYVARHPNLVALELSSFKCGMDAPIYSAIERIVEATGTPYFSFKDIDENKPAGSIKIRIETIAYFLSRYQERMVQRGHAGSPLSGDYAAILAESFEAADGRLRLPVLGASRPAIATCGPTGCPS
jgi:activator of 2-hydroxyglutaryl-CoA dehydratase/predicted nucleotide-binding protein (sugar kinase/HSP70/actin superfamily)